MLRNLDRWAVEAIFVASISAIAGVVANLYFLVGVAVVSGLLILVFEIKRSSMKASVDDAPRPSVRDVVSVNQRGGQTAGFITNLGLQPRTLKGGDTSELKTQLREYRGTNVLIASVTLNAESSQFADEIAGMLRDAEWNVSINRTLLTHTRGIIIRTPDQDLPAALETVARGLAQLGFQVGTATGIPEASGNELLVLTN